jgi:A/G-specific adenine glycosylase
MRFPRSLTQAAAFRQALRRWFRRHGRDLPWRQTRDPYRILVAEFMLQQTQVSRVLPYYLRFLERYPTIQLLAMAPVTGVRESWDGLGYYRRANNLHCLARTVVRDGDGRVPSDPTELRRLPGVGRYTAGAVASFAFEQRSAAVDTNVARVLRRVFYARARRPVTNSELWRTAERLLPRRKKSAWTFNQAIMELGALVCTAQRPRCAHCPVNHVCGTASRSCEGVTLSAAKEPKRRSSSTLLRQRVLPVRASRQSTPQSVAGYGARQSSGPLRPRGPDARGAQPWEGQ